VLRGLEPPATDEETIAAARQYVRKVAGLTTISDANRDAVERAVAQVAEATRSLLVELPPRRQPPTTVPPNRRRG
jgi:hypothetical protein